MNEKCKSFSALCVLLLLPISLTACSLSNSLTNKNAQKGIYYGTAEADQVDITAELSGKIKEIKIEEGTKIKVGDLIGIIDSTENKLKADQAEISIKNAENELGKIQEGSRDEEIKAQKAVVEQFNALVKQGEPALQQATTNINSAQIAFDRKNQVYEDVKTLYEKGIDTKYSLDTAKNELDIAKNNLDNAKQFLNTSQSQLESSRAQLEAANQKLNLLVKGATEKTKTTAEYSIEQTKKNYELAKLMVDKNNILASSDGVIESLNYKVGEYVTPGSSIATLIDLTNMWVKVFVPEKELSNIKLGKEVIIKSDFLKDKVIKGKIIYISSEAEFTPMNIVTKEDRVKLVFAVKVKILNNLEAIKPGMLLDVNLE